MRAEAKALARLLCASAPRTALRRRLGLVAGGGLLELAARYPYPPASAVSSSLGIVSELLVCALMPDPRSAGSDDEAASLARDLVGNIIFAASRRPAAAAVVACLAFAPENDIESCIWTDAHLRSRASQVATAISARFRPR